MAHLASEVHHAVIDASTISYDTNLPINLNKPYYLFEKQISKQPIQLDVVYEIT